MNLESQSQHQESENRDKDETEEVPKKKVVQLGKQFRFIEKIDGGSFGEIYHAVDELSNQEVAVKLEKLDAKHKLLSYEAKVLQFINNSPNSTGFPHVYYCSAEQGYNIMVMELLGPSLEDLLNICNRKFSSRTVAVIGKQAVERLQFLHSRYYIHRDIKPENICIGLGENNKTIYLVDMAFCKRFINKDGTHIQNQDVKAFTGTARYASVNAQNIKEQSRRDDLISLGYTLIYLMKGKLPWQDCKAQTKKEKFDKILDKKENTQIDQLCIKLPEELKDYMRDVTSLEFEQKPDYAKLLKLFEEMAKKNAAPDQNNDFDWNIVAQDVGQDIQ